MSAATITGSDWGPVAIEAADFEEHMAGLPTDQDPDVGEAHGGQLRMAYRLARGYADRLLHVKGLGWHVWDGRRWAEDDLGGADDAVRSILRDALAESLGDLELRKDVRRCESANGISGVLEIASTMPTFAATIAQLDSDPYLLNCANGTFNLQTGALLPHNPADRITKVTNASYRPGQCGQLWEGFLDRVLPDEDVRGFLQRYVGMALCGKVLEHRLAILTGTGRNGKGVTYGALAHALGDYAGSAEPDLLLHRDNAHPTGQMDLRGMRWVVVSESDKGRNLAEATVKRLTGGDKIKARRMRQDFVEFDPSHTVALITNHLPKVSGDDPALWARLRVVPFGVVVPEEEQDPRLGEKLESEADAILTWAVDGWAAYRDGGGLAEPEAVREATSAYKADSDAVGRFLADCTIKNPHMQVAVGDLFDAWSAWAADDGAEPMGKKAFGEAMNKRGYSVARTSGGRHVRKGLGLAAGEGQEWGQK